jgi:FlaA1/EpsC-like NDP-sugar epimerase
MSDQQQPDPHAMTRPIQFTPTMRRDVYPAIDPKNPENSAAGKNILITGGGRGIGKVTHSPLTLNHY